MGDEGRDDGSEETDRPDHSEDAAGEDELDGRGVREAHGEEIRDGRRRGGRVGGGGMRMMIRR